VTKNVERSVCKSCNSQLLQTVVHTSSGSYGTSVLVLISFRPTCLPIAMKLFFYAQYTPPTPTRRNCRVSSRRRCVHEFATSRRQFRLVVGVNTPVGSRELGHGRRLCCAFASPNPSAVVANSCTHRRRDATKEFRRVGVGGVYWALW